MSKKNKPEKYHFSGYATKHGIKCSDGRTIMKDAFKHQDGVTVPLVWQHLHNDPTNILGHAYLENREDGVYCYGTFNNTEKGLAAKESVVHKDIDSLSIYANKLDEKTGLVKHGMIREISLVLAGANPGAYIENISISHADGTWTDDDTEALIYSGEEITNIMEHNDKKTAVINAAEQNDKKTKGLDDIFETLNDEQKSLVHAMLTRTEQNDLQHANKAGEKTVQDVFNTFTEEQKQVVYYMIGTAIEDTNNGQMKQSDMEDGGEDMKRNVFDQGSDPENNTLTHAQACEIVRDAKQYGSLKESFLAHVVEYGFDPIDILFPDAKDVNPGAPEVTKRNTVWVNGVLSDTNHTPFSRIKTRNADLTPDALRAKGYITGTLKKEEVIALTKRLTTPTTVYKKEKLDRDDLVDITDFDVIVWLKSIMRGLLDEEIARAVLLGDGRTIDDEDKINEQNIRPIALDNGDTFVHRVSVEFDTDTESIIDEFIRARQYYKGSGVPSLYISTSLLTEMLLIKDNIGHRLYKTVDELASVLRVSKIVEVEPMNSAVRVVGEDDERSILGIVVNLIDYTIGADKGGQIGMFDDFDIDYNQYKYLIETRVSGALTKFKSAIVIERKPEA